jgi:hypothetical protein
MNTNEQWRNLAPPITPEEEGINPPYLQRLNYNPNYYSPSEGDLNIGDNIVVGQYASDRLGNPNIRWIEVIVKQLPLHLFFPGYISCRKHI